MKKILILCLFCFCLINAADQPEAPQQTQSRIQQLKSWAERIGGKTKQLFLNNRISRNLFYRYTEFIVRRLNPSADVCPICQEHIVCMADKSNVVASCEKLFLLLKRPVSFKSADKKLVIPLHVMTNRFFRRKPSQIHWYHLACMAEQYFNCESITLEKQSTPLTRDDLKAHIIASYQQNPDLSDIELAQFAQMAEHDLAVRERADDFDRVGWGNIETLAPKFESTGTYEKCALCQLKISDEERHIVEHYLDVVGPDWVEGQYNPNWIYEYDKQILNNLRRSINSTRSENFDLYTAFCEQVGLSARENNVGLVALKILSQFLYQRVFNNNIEISKQLSRCKDRYIYLGLKEHPSSNVYEFVTKFLGPYFQGDVGNAVRYCQSFAMKAPAEWKTLFVQLPSVYQFKHKDQEEANFIKFFKYVFAKNNNKSQLELIAALNDQNDFERVNRAAVDQFLGNSIVKQKIVDIDTSSIEDVVNQFKTGAINYLIWLLPMPEKGYTDYKICILIRKNQDQQVEFIIADSLAKDRRNSLAVQQLYKKYFAE